MVYPSLLPLQIHPDDVAYGYRILIYAVDKVDGQVRVVSHFENFHDLRVDPDGWVRVPPKSVSNYGGTTPVELAIRVTSNAIRRGPNLDYFLQKAYCGTCGTDTVMQRASDLVASSEP